MDSGSQEWSYLTADVDLGGHFDPPFTTALNDPFMISLHMNIPPVMGEPDLTSAKLSAAPKELSPERKPIPHSPQVNIKTPETLSSSLPTLAFTPSGSSAEPANGLRLISRPLEVIDEEDEQNEKEKDPSSAIEREWIKREPERFATQLFPHPHQSELRDRVYEIVTSNWWLWNEKEPHGILHPFIERLGPKSFRCRSCQKKLTRVDRAVDHFRTHLHHRPYTCQGQPGCGDVLCKYAFFTRDCLKSHCSKHEKICERCGAKVEDKNLSRHQLTRKCKRYSVY